MDWRINQLRQLYKLVSENEAAIIEAEKKDLGKVRLLQLFQIYLDHD